MYIVQLVFSDNKSSASQYMPGHIEWLNRGFDDGVFLLSGSLQPEMGGAILADNTSVKELNDRLAQDPFVTENVVTAKIVEITPSRTDKRLEFLIPE